MGDLKMTEVKGIKHRSLRVGGHRRRSRNRRVGKRELRTRREGRLAQIPVVTDHEDRSKDDGKGNKSRDWMTIEQATQMHTTFSSLKKTGKHRSPEMEKRRGMHCRERRAVSMT